MVVFRLCCSLPYVVSLDSSLMRKNKGNFLCSTYHLVEHPGGRSLRFPVGMGIDIHGGSHIGVAQKFLHILWCCAIGQQIGCEGMSEQMEMKLSQIRHYFPRPAADAAHRCGGFKGSVRSYTDHGQFLIPLRYFLGSGQAVHLVVDPVLFPYGSKQGKLFYSAPATLSRSRAEVLFASLVEWA